MAKSKKEKFQGELLAGQKGAAVEVPFDPAQKWKIDARTLWPGRRGHAVRAELNGVSFEGCIVPRSRKFWVMIDEDIQSEAGVAAGDQVNVTVEPYEEERKPQRANKAGVTFDMVREIALALPGVEEASSYKTHTFRTHGRLLSRFHEDRDSLMLKVDYTTREVLTGARPEVFYITDHYRCWPLMLVRLNSVDVNLLRGLMEDAWRGLASKRAITEYQTGRDSQSQTKLGE